VSEVERHTTGEALAGRIAYEIEEGMGGG